MVSLPFNRKYRKLSDRSEIPNFSMFYVIFENAKWFGFVLLFSKFTRAKNPKRRPWWMKCRDACSTRSGSKTMSFTLFYRHLLKFSCALNFLRICFVLTKSFILRTRGLPQTSWRYVKYCQISTLPGPICCFQTLIKGVNFFCLSHKYYWWPVKT